MKIRFSLNESYISSLELFKGVFTQKRFLNPRLHFVREMLFPFHRKWRLDFPEKQRC